MADADGSDSVSQCVVCPAPAGDNRELDLGAVDGACVNWTLDFEEPERVRMWRRARGDRGASPAVPPWPSPRPSAACPQAVSGDAVGIPDHTR
jgi:hypothetical protein